MSTTSPTVPSRSVCPITKAYSPDKPLKTHTFVSHSLRPAQKMHLEWAWGLQPHQLTVKSVRNCIGYRSDILGNSLNGDFVLVPTMATLNRMIAYWALPCDTPTVYHTRTLGIEFIKHRRIPFTDYMPETSFRYFFVPITPAGSSIRSQYLQDPSSSLLEADYSGSFDPVPGDDVDPETLTQFRVVTSHVHPFFVALTALGLLLPIRNRPGHWPLWTAVYWFMHFCMDASDYPPAWFRRRYKGIEFEKEYDDDERMDVETTDEEGGEF
ncbi:hypothetical protein EDD18DRAFT_611661 [Armillaria luteobubalina]|uniref:Uncharacterized protein n=1 Tax=Armillaria luteobubalina TaxID=153913 RepID=A0AA39QHB0_9AGAR|nr:hypothetical protein EDD18DRAFT_611661 [Armillaria luteobubalina]